MKFKKNRENLMKFAYELYLKFMTYGDPVFLCIGSDKWVCDSVAPIVAEILKNEYNVEAYVYGGLNYNVNATNLIEAVNYIETIHPRKTIVLIDATLGENVGDIELREGAFAGMGRCLPIKKIGTISILGVVGKKTRYFDLNSTRLANVLKLSGFIAKGCFLAVSYYNNSKSNIKKQKQTNTNY